MATIKVVHIYLSTQVESTTERIDALSTPLKDSERRLRPLKLSASFAIFTVRGVKGNFSARQVSRL